MKMENYEKQIISIPFTNGRPPLKVKTWSMRHAFEFGMFGRDLAYADLRGTDLGGINLNTMDFHGADFEGANLRGCIFHKTDLSNTNLRYTDLRYASFYQANLRGADLRFARWLAENKEERTAFFAEACLLGTKLPLDANEELLKEKILAIEREMNAAMALPDPCLVSEKKYLKLTTMELIRKMDDEELMNWICNIRNACLREFRKGVEQPQCWLEWLQSDNPDGVDGSDECKD